MVEARRARRNWDPTFFGQADNGLVAQTPSSQSPRNAAAEDSVTAGQAGEAPPLSARRRSRSGEDATPLFRVLPKAAATLEVPASVGGIEAELARAPKGAEESGLSRLPPGLRKSGEQWIPPGRRKSAKPATRSFALPKTRSFTLPPQRTSSPPPPPPVRAKTLPPVQALSPLQSVAPLQTLTPLQALTAAPSLQPLAAPSPTALRSLPPAPPARHVEAAPATRVAVPMATLAPLPPPPLPIPGFAALRDPVPLARVTPTYTAYNSDETRPRDAYALPSGSYLEPLRDRFRRGLQSLGLDQHGLAMQAVRRVQTLQVWTTGLMAVFAFSSGYLLGTSQNAPTEPALALGLGNIAAQQGSVTAQQPPARSNTTSTESLSDVAAKLRRQSSTIAPDLRHIDIKDLPVETRR